MATGVQVWNQSPASNATSDSNINLAEGMAPSSLNDSVRSMMASVAKWNNDNNGTLITSGSSTALTLVTNQVEGALTAGFTVGFQFGTGVSSNATLAVDGLAAKPLQIIPGTNVTGGEYPANSFGNFTYSTTGTGQWIATPTPPISASVVQSTSIAGAGPTVSNSVQLMAGLGATATITPVRSTRCLVIVTCVLASSLDQGALFLSGRFGTGTAPTAGAAVAGTPWGGLLVGQNSGAAGAMPFTLAAVIPGLTVGTAYWIDVAFMGNQNTYTVTVSNPAFTILEI